MLSQREIRFQKQKIIGGSFLKNKVRKVLALAQRFLIGFRLV